MNDKKAYIQKISFLVIGLVIGFVLWHRAPMGHDMNVMPEQESGMSGMMHDMNVALAGKEGDAFDRAFIDGMIIHHQGAIDMANLALAHAGHAEVKDLANDIITAQTTEITLMKKWRADWFK